MAGEHHRHGARQRRQTLSDTFLRWRLNRFHQTQGLTGSAACVQEPAQASGLAQGRAWVPARMRWLQASPGLQLQPQARQLQLQALPPLPPQSVPPQVPPPVQMQPPSALLLLLLPLAPQQVRQPRQQGLAPHPGMQLPRWAPTPPQQSLRAHQPARLLCQRWLLLPLQAQGQPPPRWRWWSGWPLLQRWPPWPKCQAWLLLPSSSPPPRSSSQRMLPPSPPWQWWWSQLLCQPLRRRQQAQRRWLSQHCPLRPL